MEFKSMTLVFMSPLYSHYLSGPAENTARQTPAKAKTTRSLDRGTLTLATLLMHRALGSGPSPSVAGLTISQKLKAN